MFVVGNARLFCRPWSRTTGIAAALRLASAVLLSAWVGLATAHAEECAQPAARGCPLALNEVVSAALSDAADAHVWRLAVGSASDLWLELTDLDANYRLYVYDAEGTLLGLSSNDGTEDEVVELLDAEPGAYFVMIDSPEEEASEAPYRLRARRIGEPAFVWQWGPEPAVEADDPPARSRQAGSSAASSSGMGLPVLPWPPPSPPAVGLPPWTVPPSVYRQPVPSAGSSAATTSTVAPVTSARPPDVASVTQAATRGTAVTSTGQSNGDRNGNRGRSRQED